MNTQNIRIRLKNFLSLEGTKQPGPGVVRRENVQAPLGSFPI